MYVTCYRYLHFTSVMDHPTPLSTLTPPLVFPPPPPPSSHPFFLCPSPFAFSCPYHHSPPSPITLLIITSTPPPQHTHKPHLLCFSPVAMRQWQKQAPGSWSQQSPSPHTPSKRKIKHYYTDTHTHHTPHRLQLCSNEVRYERDVVRIMINM